MPNIPVQNLISQSKAKTVKTQVKRVNLQQESQAECSGRVYLAAKISTLPNFDDSVG